MIYKNNFPTQFHIFHLECLVPRKVSRVFTFYKSSREHNFIRVPPWIKKNNVNLQANPYEKCVVWLKSPQEKEADDHQNLHFREGF